MREQIQALINKLIECKFYATASALQEELKDLHSGEELNKLFEDTAPLRRDYQI